MRETQLDLMKEKPEWRIVLIAILVFSVLGGLFLPPAATSWLPEPLAGGTVFADDPPIGGSNWNADGVEFQYYSTYGSNHEYWTYWLNGTDTVTIGPGLNTYLSSQETSVEVYTGKVALSQGAARTAQSYATTVYGPGHVWFDKETLEPIQRLTRANAFFVGGVQSKVWAINASGLPSDRGLSGGETWSYTEYTDAYADNAFMRGLADSGDRNPAIAVSVSAATSAVTVAGMTFDCYTITKNPSDLGTNITEYWDKDGALACAVKNVDPTAFDATQTLELSYHDWPDQPTITPCDSGGTSNTAFDATDTVYLKGDWVTLNSSVDSNCLYDVWAGTTSPTDGADLSTWGSQLASDVNVGPQSGNNVPGSFGKGAGAYGPVDLGQLSAGTYYIVVDDGDGTYHLDTNTFEQDGVAWGSNTYAVGSTSYDDGISGAITVTGAALPDLSFSSATYTAGEGDGTDTITVNLSEAAGAQVTVNYATSDGTASAGSD